MTGHIELRPLCSQFVASVNNCHMYHFDTHWELRQNEATFLDFNSRTYAMLSASLKPLEDRSFVHVVYSRTKGSYKLSASLPRLQQSYYVNSAGQFESSNMPGWIVDDNQFSGTMVGLMHQLVLKELKGDHRRVLIPWGEVKYKSNGDHVQVLIGRSFDQRQVKVFEYFIDRQLGRLRCASGLHARLYQIYLHAVCSHCLPDPLTMRTGTEEALEELSCAACFSFQRLREEECELLSLIASLTPLRKFYPPGMKVMEDVKWCDLPVLNQHPDFLLKATDITEFASQLRSLNKEISSVDLPISNRLLKRTVHHNVFSYYAPVDAARWGQIVDASYGEEWSLGMVPERRAASVATVVFRGQCVASSIPLFKIFMEWATMKSSVEGVSLSYSKLTWLDVDFGRTWLSVHAQCQMRGISWKQKMYQLLFSLPAMCFKSEIHLKVVPFIIALAKLSDQSSSLVPVPQWLSYNLSAGMFDPRYLFITLI
jgi:hypothetical protein